MEIANNLEFFFQVQGKWNVDIALAFAFEGDSVDDACHYLQIPAPWLAVAPAWRDFSGKKNERCILYGPPAMEISRVMLIGLGKAENIYNGHAHKHEENSSFESDNCCEKTPDYNGFHTVRLAFAKAIVACRDMGLESVGIDMVSLARIATSFGYTKEEAAREISLAAYLALYSYKKFKKVAKKDDGKDKEEPCLRKLSFLLDDDFCEDNLKDAVRFAEAEAFGIYRARDLVNAPSNFMTPSQFADQAEFVAKTYADYGMSCKVLSLEEIKAENMGALIAVAQGSKEEARFVVLEFSQKKLSPEELAKRPIALIGKGVTFDSGGISLKPSAGMGEMKCDMGGAAAVLGAFQSLGELAKLGGDAVPKRKIVGCIPLVENMPSGTAIKPGDIVYSKKGKSIEILNTDAEGRLILVDALTYAEEKFDPAYMLDIATLTGACAIALGNGAAGVFASKDCLAKHIQKAGDKYFERAWHLPLWDHLMDGLKSNVADISNVGGREGGALTAALFLKQFIDEKRAWVHIDMAAADNGEDALTPKGATGYGVRLLLDYALTDFKETLI